MSELTPERLREWAKEREREAETEQPYGCVFWAV